MILPLWIVEVVLVVALIPWIGLLVAVVVAALAHRLAGRGTINPTHPPTTRFLIVVPAHDEAGVIRETVQSCLGVDYPPDLLQVVVIADNCTDETADVAEAAGADVVVRVDPTRKSKGFALEDFFDGVITHPDLRPADAFVLVDADTSVARDILRAFDQGLGRGDDFIQGYYTVRNADASWRTRMMTYAFSLVNGVWLAGFDALGLSVGLKGNGMCFRAAALRRFPWRVHGLVEDMEYAWALRIAGEQVRFARHARVFGEMVSRGGSGAASQRRRWESGRQALRASVRPRLWRSANLSSLQKLVYAVDLGFPPIGRLVVVLGVVTSLGICGFWMSGFAARWVMLLLGTLVGWFGLAAYAVSPLFVVGLPARYLASLLQFPYYLGWKLTVGLLQAPRQWVRTPREVAATHAADQTEK